MKSRRLLAGVLALGPLATVAGAQAPRPTEVRAPILVLARPDSVFLFIDSVAPRGHAWRVVRSDGVVVAPALEPERALDRVTERLGPELPLAWRLTRADDEVSLVRRLTADRGVAFTGLLLSRRIADVTGRLAVDTAPSRAAGITYRAELVRRSDGAVRGTLVTPLPVRPSVAAIPDSVRATSVLEGVRLRWRYPRYAGTPEDVVVGFVIERAVGDGPWTTLDADPVLRDDGRPHGWQDGDVVDGQSYRYRVRPMLIGGALAAPSASVTVSMRDRLAPLAPLQAAAEVQDGAVRIVWSLPPDPDVAGFVVERRRGGSDSTWTRLTRLPLGPRSLSFTDSTVRGGSIYAWRVRAFDVAGNAGEWATPVTARADERTPPDAPRALAATVGDGRRATYRWRAPAARDVAGYHVYRRQLGGAPVRLTGLPVLATTYVDSAAAGEGLMPGFTYRIEVSAMDSSGNESPRAAVELAVKDDDVPGAPRTVDARGRFGGSVTVTWAASPALDVARYEVVAREGALPPRAVGRVGARGPMLVVDTLARDGVPLRYAVVAVDSAGNRSAPGEATITKQDEERPSPPRAVRAVRQGAAVRVQWERVMSRDLEGYVVLRAPSPGGTRTEVGRVAADVTELVDRSAPAAAFYTVVAVDRTGNRSNVPPVVAAAGGRP